MEAYFNDWDVIMLRWHNFEGGKMVYTLVDYTMMYWYLNFSGMPYSDEGVYHCSRLIIEESRFLWWELLYQIVV